MEYLNILLEFPVALPFTGLFICLLLLLLSIIGLAFDADIDHDIAGNSIFVTSGLSKVPLVIGMTFTFLPMTFLTALLNELIFKIDFIQSFFQSGTLGSVVYYIITTLSLLFLFVISLFIGGFLVKPIQKIITIEDKPIEYLGKQGIVTSHKLDSNSGEIRIIVNNQECLLSAYSEEQLAYGEKIEIISIEDKKIIVKKLIN